MASYPPPPPPPTPPPPPPPATIRERSGGYRDQLRAQVRAQRDAAGAQLPIRAQMRGMRRGSVLSPILLIAIGVVFLLIRPDVWITSFLGLVRTLVASAAGGGRRGVAGRVGLRPGPHARSPASALPRSAGFGVFLMLFFLVLAGVIGHHITSGERWDNGGWHFDQDSFDELSGDRHESDQTLDLAFPAGEPLAVMNPRGDVTTMAPATTDGSTSPSTSRCTRARTPKPTARRNS